MKVLRTYSTRTPIFRKQSGREAAGGFGSVVAGGGAARRRGSAVETSGGGAGAGEMRARHQPEEAEAGVGPSAATGLWSRAGAWPWAVPGCTFVYPARARTEIAMSRRRRLSSLLRSRCAGLSSPSYDA